MNLCNRNGDAACLQFLEYEIVVKIKSQVDLTIVM